MNRFTAYGFVYMGAFQYLLYIRYFGLWFPRARAFGEHTTLRARLADSAGLKDLEGRRRGVVGV